MYPNNIYIKNFATIDKYKGDVGVQLDKFEHEHGVKKDVLARAQFKHWLNKERGVYVPLSVTEREMLGI